MIVNNDRLHAFLRDAYAHEDVQKLKCFLQSCGTFYFPRLETGLFPAAHLGERGQYTGYHNIWVRDNIHVAHAHLVAGQANVAVKTAEALRFYFGKQRHRWESIIQGLADPAVVIDRPHIRFDGKALEDLDVQWCHAQNDALGYFLWFYCKLARRGLVPTEPEHWEILGWFPLFFESIRYWEDEDSGHWEEARKIEASSIGVVVAALTMMRTLMIAKRQPSFITAGRRVTLSLLDDLIWHGKETLGQILPAECIQPGRKRQYDAALLFLIYPLEIATAEQADAILLAVETHLRGEYGIRRYLGDSFWCADYDQLVRPEQRTADVSEDMSARDTLVRAGEEAQWCIFDPIISAIYGRRYEQTGDEVYIAKQVHHFNRSLGQLTGANTGFREFLCPELYYLRNGRYVPNDVTPLLWTQANLLVAFHQMEITADQ